MGRRVYFAAILGAMGTPWLIAVMGPTASGKTEFAETLADETGCQLINADAFQVYRWLDIGTGKSPRRAEYRMMDIIEPWEAFGAGDWIQRTVVHLHDLFENGKGAILVGGTLYYIRALLEQYADMHGPADPELRSKLSALELPELRTMLLSRDPAAADKVDLQNRIRVQRALERLDAPAISWTLPPFRTLKLSVDLQPELLRERIERRVDQMLSSGWLEEVAKLPERGVSRENPGMRAHGYRALWDVAFEGHELDVARAGVALEVAQYAKRQRTWLRKEPNVVKMPSQDEGNALAAAKAMILGV